MAQGLNMAWLSVLLVKLHLRQFQNEFKSLDEAHLFNRSRNRCRNMSHGYRLTSINRFSRSILERCYEIIECWWRKHMLATPSESSLNTYNVTYIKNLGSLDYWHCVVRKCQILFVRNIFINNRQISIKLWFNQYCWWISIDSIFNQFVSIIDIQNCSNCEIG